MTTEMSSDAAKNSSQPFTDQKAEDLTWKKGDPTTLRKLVLPMATRKVVQTISAILPVILCSRRWIVIDANRSHGEDLSIQVSKMVTKMVRHHGQDELEQDGSYHWDTVRSVLLKAFATNEAEAFSDNYWIHLIHEGSSKRRVEYCVDHKRSLCHHRAIRGHSGGIPIVPELMECTSIRYEWRECIFHRGCSWDMQSILGSGLIPGGEENDKARQAVFFTLLNPFGENPGHYHSHGKRKQDAVYWIKLSRAQDQGLQFWQTKSFAIITHSPVPGDCIYKVVSEKGDESHV